jgi:hypothetical protein
MSRTYRALDIPKQTSREMREFLENINRFLQEMNTSQGGSQVVTTEEPAGVASKASPSQPGFMLMSGDLKGIPVGPPGTRLTLRFQAGTVVESTQKVRLHSTFTAADTEDTLSLISDGQRWYEYARSCTGATTVTGPVSLVAPVIINEDGLPVNPVIRIESDNNEALVRMDGAEDVLNLFGDTGGTGMIQIGGYTSLVAGTAVRYDHQGIIEIEVGSYKIYIDPGTNYVQFGGATKSAVGEQPIEFQERPGFESGFAYRRTEASTTRSINSNECYVAVVSPFDGTSASITLTLPLVASIKKGGVIIVKDETNTAGTPFDIVIDGNGSETVDGAASVSIENPGQSVFLISNGSTGWTQFL